MSTPKEHVQFQYQELRRLRGELGMMQRWGVSALDPGFLRLQGAIDEAVTKVGFRLPRTTTLIRLLVGLSPGTIKLWADAEIGWVTESTVKPGAPAVFRQVADEIAETLLTGKLTHELEEFLMTPDEYYGE